MTGTDLIRVERERQVSEEGWTAEHDLHHRGAELSRAAICYLRLAYHQAFLQITQEVGASFEKPPREWPWDETWWRPSADPMRNLAKAGALVAAEIDRVHDVLTPPVEIPAVKPEIDAAIREARDQTDASSEISLFLTQETYDVLSQWVEFVKDVAYYRGVQVTIADQSEPWGVFILNGGTSDE